MVLLPLRFPRRLINGRCVTEQLRGSECINWGVSIEAGPSCSTRLFFYRRKIKFPNIRVPQQNWISMKEVSFGAKIGLPRMECAGDKCKSGWEMCRKMCLGEHRNICSVMKMDWGCGQIQGLWPAGGQIGLDNDSVPTLLSLHISQTSIWSGELELKLHDPKAGTDETPAGEPFTIIWSMLYMQYFLTTGSMKLTCFWYK